MGNVKPSRAHRRAQGRVLLGAVLALLVVACGGEPAPAEMEAADHALSADRFVEVVAALREAERETAEEDSAEIRFAERRADILDRHGVTEAELREFVRVHAGEPGLLNVVWDSINERLKHQVESTADPLRGRPGHRVR